MRKLLVIILTILLGISLGIAGALFFKRSLVSFSFLSPLGEKKVEEKPLKRFEYQRLINFYQPLYKQRPFVSRTKIELGEKIQETDQFTSYLFTFQSQGKKISGLTNIPKGTGPFPVIVMLRGYVDQEIYQPGMGTQPAGEVFAGNGFVTIAPDYLGYGSSDKEPENYFEEMFLRIVNVLDLILSVGSIKEIDVDQIGVWGHSNGGLASLTVKALTKAGFPTTLWAPVSQYFPYNDLYFTWEADDRGKSLRKVLAEFEKDYETDKYSYDLFMEGIKGPVQLHQGTADLYIPLSWSDNLAEKLKNLGVEVNYYQYFGADHNLRNNAGSWDLVAQRDLEFFRKNLKYLE